MKTVGLTGGIGSGKSTLGKWFSEDGIPVYISDDEAKKLTDEDPEVKEKILEAFGPESYKDGIYNRKFISSVVFKNKEKLAELNSIIHPAVFRHYENWIKKQDAPFVVKEAAILFESGSYKDCDAIISVAADEEIRIERVVKRDGVDPEMVRARMRNQWTDEQRIKHSDFVIYNNSNLKQLKSEYRKVLKKLLNQFESS